MTTQLDLFPTTTVLGRVSHKPVPQDKHVLLPMLIDPAQELERFAYWRYSCETRKGWIFEVVRALGYGTFNGVEVIYCENPDGTIQEYGPFHLFPAKKSEIAAFWGI